MNDKSLRYGEAKVCYVCIVVMYLPSWLRIIIGLVYLYLTRQEVVSALVRFPM